MADIWQSVSVLDPPGDHLLQARMNAGLTSGPPSNDWLVSMFADPSGNMKQPCGHILKPTSPPPTKTKLVRRALVSIPPRDYVVGTLSLVLAVSLRSWWIIIQPKSYLWVEWFGVLVPHAWLELWGSSAQPVKHANPVGWRRRNGVGKFLGPQCRPNDMGDLATLMGFQLGRLSLCQSYD